MSASMIEASEKSTVTRAQIADSIWLDGRLAIWHETSNWLALSDVHYGYELSRKAIGGLWPNWGMAAIEERLGEMIDEYAPEKLILVGDIIDSSFVGMEGIQFLEKIIERTPGDVFFVEGNHDRGTIKAKFDWVPQFEIDGFLFHHGHQPTPLGEYQTEVVGHFHPSVNLRDGAGMSLRIPSLVQESYKNQADRWVLPAFSPWAGGGRFKIAEGCESARQWVASTTRVFELHDPTLLDR